MHCEMSHYLRKARLKGARLHSCAAPSFNQPRFIHSNDHAMINRANAHVSHSKPMGSFDRQVKAQPTRWEAQHRYSRTATTELSKQEMKLLSILNGPQLFCRAEHKQVQGSTKS